MDFNLLTFCLPSLQRKEFLKTDNCLLKELHNYWDVPFPFMPFFFPFVENWIFLAE